MLSTSAAPAQQTTLHLTTDSLHKGLPGYFLYPRPWQFHAGDNLAWVDPSLDDHSWHWFKTGNSVGNTPPGWQGIGWFRLHFTLDSALAGQPLALRIAHMGASDIYLDGRRIGGFGKVGHSLATETTYIPDNELVAFQVNHPGPHVLAVRLSVFHQYLTRKVRLGQGFLAWIGTQDKMTTGLLYRSRANALNLIPAAGPGLFALLHLFLFLFYPARKSNLYYSLCLLCFAVCSVCVFFDNIVTNPDTQRVLFWLFYSGNVAIPFLMVVFTYSICYSRQPRQVWLFGSIAFLFLPTSVLFPGFDTNLLFWCFMNVSILEVFRVISLAMYRQQPYVWLIGVGMLITIIAASLALNSVFAALWYNHPYGSSITIAFGFLSLPLCTSLYLAKDFARTNISLATQLQQVSELSAEKLKLVAEQNVVLEQTVQERTEKIQQQADKLREMDAIKSRFFTNLAHEFRTPLTLMLGPAEQVLAETGEPKTKQQVGLLQRNALRLLQLINQLLDLSKLEAGKTQLTPRSDDMVGLVKGTLLSFESLAHQKQIALQVKADCDTLIMDIDRDKLEKILYNLFSNAIKFTPSGGDVFVRLTHEVVRQEPWVQLVVQDTGVGIPATKLPYVFDHFYQVDASNTREQEGFGIGLALTKELVELHSGSIQIESIESVGTTVTVRLPIRQEQPVQDALPPVLPASYSAVTTISTPLPPSPQAADAPELLLIEDNNEVRAFIRSSLGGISPSDQYRIREAVNGEEGVQLAQEWVPDLIITDLMMPKLDGYQVCQALKQDERTSHIPIVMLTAKADLDSRVEGLQTGADSYLAKPFHQRELLAQIANLITSRQQLRERFSRDNLWDKGITLPSLEQAFLDRVRTAIDARLDDESFSVDQLSDDIGVSRTQLHRKLKALVNQSPGDLIRVVRLQRALDLLTRNVATVSEVAYMVGFGNPASFSTSFSRHFGYAPSEVKKNVDTSVS